MPNRQRRTQQNSLRIKIALAKIEAQYDLVRFLARDPQGLSPETQRRLAGLLNGANLMYEEFGLETPDDIVKLTQIWNGEEISEPPPPLDTLAPRSGS